MSEHDPAEYDDRTFHAYATREDPPFELTPASARREWMEQNRGLGYGCLPLTIANQNGWVLTTPIGFAAVWNGGPSDHDLRIQCESPGRIGAVPFGSSTISVGDGFAEADVPEPHPAERMITSAFGLGVISIVIPYVFRTPPGVNLWVKGPANHIKDGVQALEGIVETDWSPSTFTMNWKMTRPNHVVRFAAGEPVCMLTPIPRHLTEQLQPVTGPITSNAKLAEDYSHWYARRLQSLDRNAEVPLPRWERDYYKGRMRDGSIFPAHQSELTLQPFVKVSE